MATNRVFAHNSPLSVAVASTVKSNDVVAIGGMIGVALTNYNADTGEAAVDFSGVYALPVKGVDASGNVAIAVGDPLYYTSTDTPPISKKSTGILVGYAMGTVTSGTTTTATAVRLSGGGSTKVGPSISAEITANGSPQNYAHGLGITPTRVVVTPTNIPTGTAGFVVTEGSHTGTNAIVTVTPSGAKYKVMVFA